MVKVSVIVPNYNHASYLQQRIDSILTQTYQDFELIILDDCSTDNSKDIIEQYRDHPRVSQIVYNEINSGSTFKQWNKGISLAKGDYIWIAESDDWCEPTLLETLMSGFKKNMQLVLGFVQSYYIIEENEVSWTSTEPFLYYEESGGKFLKSRLVNGNAIFNASMAIFKKDAYSKISSNYLDYKYCGDWLFWAEIAIQGDVYISGKILNYFRNHRRDVSSMAISTGLNFIEEFNVLTTFRLNNYISQDQFYEVFLSKYLIYTENKNNLTKDNHYKVEAAISANQSLSEILNDILKEKKVRQINKRRKLKALKKIIKKFIHINYEKRSVCNSLLL